jgi:hypothetical protein
MGPEVGGLVALGMIGGFAGLIAWLNNGSCKLGRHTWNLWQRRDVAGTGYVQERTCKKCGFLQQKLGGCAVGDHLWSVWADCDDQTKGSRQERHCSVCSKVEKTKGSCSSGNHTWSSWGNPINTGKYYTESGKTIYRQDRSCTICNAQDSQTFSK